MDLYSVPITSTYQEDFQSSSSTCLPPLFEFQPNRFNKNQDLLAPRCYPIAQPIVPHRKRDSEIPIAPGFSTFLHRIASIKNDPNVTHSTVDANSRPLTSSTPTRPTTASKGETQLQPIDIKKQQSLIELASPSLESPPTTPPSSKQSSRQSPDNCQKHESVPGLVLKELVNHGHYTPSSQGASCFIKKPKPITPITLTMRREFWQKNIHRDGIINSGRILGQSKNKPETWQTVGCIWDKLQERKATTVSQCMEPLSKENCRLLNRPRCGEKINRSFYTNDCSNKLSSNIPGYGGYQPRLPISGVKIYAGNRVQTMSNVTYRQHPKLTYKLPIYGHKAPMSCTVTLTEPYNPFNKIVKEEIVY